MRSRTKFLTLRVTGQRWYYERSGGGNTPSTPWRCESPGKGLLPSRSGRSCPSHPERSAPGTPPAGVATGPVPVEWSGRDHARRFESKVGRLNADHHHPVLRRSGSGSPTRHPSNCSDVTVRRSAVLWADD